MTALPVPHDPRALIGRESERSLVQSFLESFAEGGDCFFLCGDPGIGKTAILDVAHRMASGRAVVLRARGVQFETDISFSGLNQLLLPLRDDIDRLPTRLAAPLAIALGFAAGTRPSGEVIADAVLAVLRVAARSCPVLVIVDDLQWLDPASIAVVEFLTAHIEGDRIGLAGHVDGNRIGLLAAYRLGVDFGRRRLNGLELQPLSDAASNALLSEHSPHLSAPRRRRVLDEARGHPLALIELPTALSADRLIAQGTRPDEVPSTQRLDMLFASTISELPEAARALLLVAALDGDGEVPTLQAAAPGRDVLAELAPAIAARLITLHTSERRIIFRYPMIRSAVVAISIGAERRTAHRTLAAILTSDADRRLWHLADAATEPDEALAARLEEMADRSRRLGDPVTAAAALTRSAELSPEIESRTRRIAFAAYIEGDVNGNLQQAAYRMASIGAPDTSGPGSLQAAITSASIAFNSDGDVDFAHRLLTAAISDALDGGDEDPEKTIEALHGLLEVCLYGCRPELWKSFFAVVERRGFDGASLLRLSALMIADPARTAIYGLAELDQRIAELSTERDPTLVERVATAASYVDRVRHCRPALMRIIEAARKGGAIAAAINALTIVCVDDVRTGRWDEAQDLITEGLALCEAHGYQLLSWPLQLARALLSAGRGDHSTTQQVAGAVSQLATHTGAHGLRNIAHHALAISALGRGDHEEAYVFACAISPPGVLAPNVGHALWAAFDLVEAAVRASRLTQARVHVAAMRDAGLAAMSPRLAFVVGAATAMVAPDELSGPLFEAALALRGIEDWPFERARIELFYGERLRRNRSISSAREHLGIAVELFETLGAAPFAARAKGELHATGLASERDDTGAHATLTPQEHRVAQLAASGMTNKQIAERLGITRRTVGTHLEQIFPKLSINARSALREALAGSEPALDGGSP